MPQVENTGTGESGRALHADGLALPHLAISEHVERPVPSTPVTIGGANRAIRERGVEFARQPKSIVVSPRAYDHLNARRGLEPLPPLSLARDLASRVDQCPWSQHCLRVGEESPHRACWRQWRTHGPNHCAPGDSKHHRDQRRSSDMLHHAASPLISAAHAPLAPPATGSAPTPSHRRSKGHAGHVERRSPVLVAVGSELKVRAEPMHPHGDVAAAALRVAPAVQDIERKACECGADDDEPRAPRFPARARERHLRVRWERPLRAADLGNRWAKCVVPPGAFRYRAPTRTG